MIKYKIYKILRFLHLISKEKFRKKTAKYTKEYRLIAASRLFDKDWYLEQNPDVKGDPIEHYLKKGWKEHRACTLYFNGDEYLKMNADVATANMNPLVHYLLHGRSEGRCAEVVVPSLLSVMIKKSRYTLRAIKKSSKKSLSETKKIVRTKPKKYEGKSADYILIAESEYFDKDWYLQNYPEVREAKVDPVDHYLMTGWKEGKNPGPEFDGNWYLKVHKDVARAKINPLRHYMKHRIDEKRISNICHDAPRTFMQILATCFINRRPKFSIIVASYNYQDYLKKTLDSLLKQDYPNYEIIVVDDGSSDNSVGVVKKYVKKSPRVFLYQHPGGSNRGLPETLFLGLSKATGDYIAFCESDDLWTPNHLSECVKLINKYARPEVIINDCECFGDPQDLVNKKQRYIVDRNHWMFQQNKRKFTFDEFRSNNYITTFSACMVKTSALKKCNFLTPRKAAIDWWLWRQLAFRYPIYFVNKRITEWRVHESYLEKSINEKKLFQQCFTKRMDSFLLDKNYFTRISSEDYKLIKNSKHFDWDYYKNTYGIRDGVDCVKHYYSYGWRRGFNPSLNFITNDYLLLNPEVISEDICPLLHYEKVGRSRWYRYTKNKIVDEAKIKQYWHDRKKYPTRKKVQYTCMTNGYDDLTVSDYIDPEWDYVLFTDNKKLLKQKHFYMWKCEPLKHVSADSVRTSRWHKTHPHILFPRYKYSLWCDSNQNFLTDHIYRLIDEHIKNNTLIAAYKHYCRDCLYEEAMECKKSRKDKIDVINAQINSYRQDKFPAHNGLFETGLLFRQHMDKNVVSVDDKWYEEIAKYSRRDQLSFTYTLWKNKLQCTPFEIANLREIGKDVELFRHLGSNILSKAHEIRSISVIIPIYNALADVQKLFSSLNDVEFSRDIEFILVNDCSKEDTSRFLNKHISKDSRFKLINNETNLGFVKSCNKGLKIANGDLVILLNSDTMLPKAFEKKIIYCFDHDKSIGVASPISSDTGLWKIDVPEGLSITQMDAVVEKVSQKKFPDILCPEGFCFCIRKEVIDQIGYLDEVFGMGYCEETDYAFRAMDNGWRTCLIDNLFVYHKHHASFGSARRDEQIKHNQVILWNRWRDLYDKKREKIDMNKIVTTIKDRITNELKQFEK